MQYRAKTGKLRKMGGTYPHGTVFEQKQCFYQKQSRGMERPEMYSASRCNNHTLPVRAVKRPHLEGGSIEPRTESWVNWDGPMAMVPCLH